MTMEVLTATSVSHTQDKLILIIPNVKVRFAHITKSWISMVIVLRARLTQHQMQLEESVIKYKQLAMDLGK